MKNNENVLYIIYITIYIENFTSSRQCQSVNTIKMQHSEIKLE